MAREIGPREKALREMREARYASPRPAEKMTPAKRADLERKVAAVPATKKPREARSRRPAGKTKAAKDGAKAPERETTMKTKRKTAPAKKPAKKAARPTLGKRLIKAAKEARAIARGEKTMGRPGVPALEIARFMARPADEKKAFAGGASMDELVKKFGIDAHPMRAKIYYVRHNLGWKVETRDGRYYATAPEAAS